MFTVCSKCDLRLTVTATDLRAAQGYVRCGRCRNVFNALAALADDPARQAVPASTADTQQRPVLTQPEPPHPEPEPPAPEASASDPLPDTSLEFNPTSMNISDVFIEPTDHERTGSFEAIVLEGDDEPADAVADPEAPAAVATEATEATEATDAGVPPDTVVEAGSPVQAETPAQPEASVQPEEPIKREPVARTVAPAVAAWDILREIEEPPEAGLLKRHSAVSRLPRWAFTSAAAVLGVALVVQVVHHYRAGLAGVPVLGRAVVAVYQALDVPLESGWNVAGYEIRQLGATSDTAATGNIVVRASISNKAPHEQPLPMLRVVLQDRFGNRVAARDLLPAEYLGDSAPRLNPMQPGQRVDVQVAVRDPGQAATGFEVDACVSNSDHEVACANDQGSH